MISKKIYEMRVKRGFRQIDLAEEIGIEQKDVSRWENGERTPSIENLKKLCFCLNVSADYLLELPVFDEQRYVVIKNTLDGDCECEEKFVYNTLFEANKNAYDFWHHLTKSEQKNTHICVAIVKKDDICTDLLLGDVDDVDEDDYWTAFSDYNVAEGGFDSDNFTNED